jgi:disulfide bond formation protein DsbB
MRCALPCKVMTLFLTDARAAGLLIAAISFSALAGAYFFQYVVGLPPCPLCLYQRIPHAMNVVLGLTAFIFSGRPKASASIILLASLVYMSSASIAFYHAGVEQHWWASFLEACTAQIDSASGNLLQQIEQTRAVRCDTIPWQMFGISMAGYNAVLSILTAVYALAASVMILRRSNGF